MSIGIAPRFAGIAQFEQCITGARMTTDGFDVNGDLVVDNANDPVAVAAVQGALRDLGYAIEASGAFDGVTSDAVRQFKIDQALPVPPGLGPARRGRRTGHERPAQRSLHARSRTRTGPATGSSTTGTAGLGGTDQLSCPDRHAGRPERPVRDFRHFTGDPRHRGRPGAGEPGLLPCADSRDADRWRRHDDGGESARDGSAQPERLRGRQPERV